MITNVFVFVHCIDNIIIIIISEIQEEVSGCDLKKISLWKCYKKEEEKRIELKVLLNKNAKILKLRYEWCVNMWFKII